MAQKKGKSKAQGFTHGMVSDPDPRFQIKGSYSDALNIRLTNESGDTFTVENIEGNELFVDLFAVGYQNKSNAYDSGTPGILGTRPDIINYGSNPWLSTDHFSEIYWDPNNTDSNGNTVGVNYPSPGNSSGAGQQADDGVFTFFDKNTDSLETKSSIVGYTSFGSELILIIVARFEWENDVNGASVSKTANRTIFLRVKYDNKMNVEAVEDLGVCYSYLNDNYPDLNMEIDKAVRVEALIENECISRIYWTDNKNPLRTLNLSQEGKNQLPPDTLNITPLMAPSQPVLDQTIHGSLPVGVYQYTYKYISANGGETTFSPLSNVYHTSDQGFGSSQLYGGGPKGEIGTQGFKIEINDVDQHFQYIELYALLYEELNIPPKISLVDRKNLRGVSSIKFSHITWSNEIESGLEDVLIESNTWDVCKDIAIKDNILFAANLKQKRNWISEKEWNVKVLRYNIKTSASGESDVETGILTTNDPEIKHYEEVGGEAVIPSISGINQPCTGHLHWGQEDRPAWATLVDNQRHTNNNGDLDGKVKNEFEYRFLRDGMTLGGESWDYVNNKLGGCRVSFGVKERVADITTNDGKKPYISSVNKGLEEFQTDNIWIDNNPIPHQNNTETAYHTTMSLGGSKDPHNAGNTRGYQRGEIYRFGVQVYDVNGAPGNVLWIGDIQTPEMYDVLRMIEFGTAIYSPFETSEQLSQNNIVKSHSYTQDHRLSYVYGHTVPPVDVNWFTGRTPETTQKQGAYIYANGNEQGSGHSEDMNPVTSTRRPKWYPWFNIGDQSNGYVNQHDDKHYLFDLHVNFEFIIPENVRKKISGFRVVRAERTEEDRRVIQQGILNQTLKYGKPTSWLGPTQAGYDADVNFSVKDNDNLDDDPIFTNSYSPTDPTVQPEYDTFLNGYVGLAENNHLAFYDPNLTSGKLTTGSTQGKVWARNEAGNTRINSSYGGPSLWPWRTNTTSTHIVNTEHPGSGAVGKKYMHSAIFGSYEKCQSGNTSSTSGNPKLNTAIVVPDLIFTLDSPDSAFGTRPYIFREGDMLRVDSVMKLTDERRYDNMSGAYSALATHYAANSSGSGPSGTIQEWGTGPTNTSESDALKYASKRQLDSDKDYGLLIGKYYIYDTYWGVGMETDGGQTYADNWDNVPDDTAVPNSNYRQLKTIHASKELGAGEIIPANFFKNSYMMTNGDYLGFSNNTLGFVSDQSDWYAKFGGVTGQIAQAHNPSSEAGDLNYNTMSTLQTGLRTILIETSEGTFNFHPRNLSAVLNNQSWASLKYDATAGHTSGVETDKNKYWLGNAKSTGRWKSYIPFKYLCSIIRKVVPYGGYSKSAIESTRYIACGNFHSVSYDSESSGKHGHVSKVFGGDTFVNLYAHQKTSCPYMRNSYARWQVFPVESFVNTDMRSGLTLNAGDTEVGKSPDIPPFSNDWLYNEVYSQENSIKSGIMINEEQACDALDLPFEIAYSNTKIAGEPGDAFRIFPINQFHDMEGKYGEVNRIINFKNEIFVLQDEAFAKLLVNPISMITDDTGVGIFTGTGDTVENHTYISTKFGSRHIGSVVGSEQALYFVDSRYARLFKYDEEKLISLGDSLGQRSSLNTMIKEFFDLDSFEKNGRDYISDNPLKFLGITSVFDHKNKELIVTLHNARKNVAGSNISNTIVFNEGVNAFSSYYTAVPNLWMLADPAILSTGNQISVQESIDFGSNYPPDRRQGMLKLWQWNSRSIDNLKCVFFQENGTTSRPSYIEKVINDAADSAKVFDNGQVVMTLTDDVFNTSSISFETENNPPDMISTSTARYREGILRFPLRGLNTANRMRGTWLKIRFVANTSEKFNIFAIVSKYRKSYN